MISRLIGFLLLVGSLLAGWFWMEYRQFIETPLAIEGEDVIFAVPNGASLGAVARDLQQAGYLADGRYLAWYGRYRGLANRIRAGEYELHSGMTPDDLLALLVSGRTVSYSLTLLEGWNIRQVRAAVAQHPALRDTLSGVDDAELMARLGRPELHPEGRFFPDTYHFTRGMTDLEFLRRAMRKMDREMARA
jgi:UPF0755 protein